MCRGVACFEVEQGLPDGGFVRTWLYGHIAYPVILCKEAVLLVPSIIPKMETQDV